MLNYSVRFLPGNVLFTTSSFYSMFLYYRETPKNSTFSPSAGNNTHKDSRGPSHEVHSKTAANPESAIGGDSFCPQYAIEFYE